MFLNRWTVEVNAPGQIVETGFDSRDEALVFVEKLQQGSGGVMPRVSIIDPQGQRTAQNRGTMNV